MKLILKAVDGIQNLPGQAVFDTCVRRMYCQVEETSTLDLRRLLVLHHLTALDVSEPFSVKESEGNPACNKKP